MTSKVILYKTKIIPDKNAYVDDLNVYLDTCEKCIFDNFQYIKHELDISIKVPLNQTEINSFKYNYVSIKNELDNRTFYYFINATDWKSQDAIGLTLSMDTVNTFQDKLELTNWSDHTKILRQHEDRWYQAGSMVLSNRATFANKVHKTPEGLEGLVKYKVSEEKLFNDGLTWNLVYANNDSKKDAVDCFIVPSRQIPMFSAYAKEDSSSRNRTKVYAEEIKSGEDFEYWVRYNAQWLIEVQMVYSAGNLYCHRTNGATVKLEVDGAVINTGGHPWLKQVSFYKNGNGLLTVIERYLCNDGSNLYGNSESIHVKYEDVDYIDFETTGLSGLQIMTGQYVWQKIMSRTNSQISIRNRYELEEMETTGNYFYIYGLLTGITTNTLGSVGSIDRTSSKILKIIELPYCPIPLKYITLNNPTGGTTSGYSIPFGYIRLVNGLDIINNNITSILKLIDDSATFFNDLGNIPIDDEYTSIAYSDVKSLKYNHDLDLEPKLKHSELFDVKFAYDNFTLPVRYESMCADTSRCSRYDVKFVPSNSCSSTMLFDIRPTNGQAQVPDEDSSATMLFSNQPRNEIYQQIQDYENILQVNRNNESTIYNSAYIDYVKTGYNFDIKAKKQASQQNWINFGINTAGTIAKFAYGAASKNMFSISDAMQSAVNVANSVVNNIYDDINRQDSIDRKIAEAKAQTNSVRESDTLDLFNYYNGNKLVLTKYAPNKEVRNKIMDLFHLTGYAQYKNGIPSVNSRRAFNFIQCEPVLKNETDSDWTEYINDIKARYNMGVTYYHSFDKGTTTYDYDCEQEYENWENWIVS